MPSAEDVLRRARGEIGYSRWNDPEQGTKYGRWYAKYTGNPTYAANGIHYCAIFVSWCFVMEGVQCPGFPRPVAIDRTDHLLRQVEPLDLHRGDAVGFDWHPNDSDIRADHVGLFEDWIQPGYSFRTVEGNTGDGQVLECVRYIENVTCGVRPYYDDAKNPAIQSGKLEVDGVAGSRTIVMWQTQMHTTEDAIIGDQPDYLMKYRANVWAVQNGEGKYGSELVKAVQRRCGMRGSDVDGVWGMDTSKAIQRRLKTWGYYTGEIDGYFGPASVRALQRSLNDGKWK